MDSAPFLLNEDPQWFPDPQLALSEPNGLLALGGDLCSQRLLSAYQQGIFPWYNEGEPILWWSPEPRAVLFLEDFKLSRSLKKIINNKPHTVKIDSHFELVIESCQQPRSYQPETWITPEMKAAYLELFRQGYAHSIEVYQNQQLWGGLYGISLGGAFFGESMFSKKANGSKIALHYLVAMCKHLGIFWVDCQVWSEHLAQFGTREIKRLEFLRLLQKSKEHPTQLGPWPNLWD